MQAQFQEAIEAIAEDNKTTDHLENLLSFWMVDVPPNESKSQIPVDKRYTIYAKSKENDFIRGFGEIRFT